MEPVFFIRHWILVSIFVMGACLTAGQVSSTSGAIDMDVDGDGLAEATLNDLGFGIGVNPSSNLHVDGNVIISDQLTVGSSSVGSSNLYVNGTLGRSIQELASNSNIVHSIAMADTSSGNILAILPYSANVTGQIVQIKQTSHSHHTQIATRGDAIDDYDHPLHLQSSGAGMFPYVKLISSGLGWHVLSANALAETASDNLVAGWHLDERSGSVYEDFTDGGNNLTPSGITIAGNTALGKADQGVLFGGLYTSHIPLSSDLSDIYLEDYSLSLWYKPTVLPTGGAFADADYRHGLFTKTGFHIGLLVENDARVYMNYYESDDSQHGAYSTSSLTAGTFYHLVGTVSKSTGVVKVYVNGVKEGENNIAIGGAPSTNNSTWKIGTANAGSEAYSYPAHGVIDEVRIYDKALDASEVEMLFLQYY